MKYLYTAVVALMLPALLQAQVQLVNNGTTIKAVNAGAAINVEDGSIINRNNGEIVLDGGAVLQLDGDYTQNTGATFTASHTSTVYFSGFSDQNINADTDFNVGRLLTFGSDLILGTNVTASNRINLLGGNGKVRLGNFNLTVFSGGDIVNYSENTFIQTNGTGILQQEVGGSNVVFPVGNSSYNPVTLNNSGTTDNFQIRVTEQVLDNGTSGVTITNNVVGRTWLIDETVVGGSDVTMTLQWDATAELTAFDRTNSGIAHHINGSLWDNPTTYTAATNISGSTWSQTRSGFTSFSPFVVRDNSAVDLPVELIRFEAKRLNPEQVQLDWATATETNNAGFYIERMLDNEATFKSVEFIDGMGTVLDRTNYQFIDENAFRGVSYYRLKQIDFDGTVSYSEIRAVSGEGELNTSYIDVSIYPNPVYNELKVRFNELPESVKSANVRILGMDGKILHNFNAGLQSYQVLEIEYVKDLIPGMYLLSIELDNGEQILQKFIKK